MARDGKISEAIGEAVAGLILVHGDAENPGRTGFDAPMRPRDFGEARRAQFGARARPDQMESFDR